MDARIIQEIAGDAKVITLPSGTPIGQSSCAASRTASNPSVRAAAESYFESPDRLHGDTQPSATIIHEKAIHRMMCYLHASGASVEDIAEQTGYTKTAVSNVLRQPWARERVLQILKETGQDRIKHFLTHQVSPSLETLQEVRDNKAASAQARIAAANAILDRALGKPMQHVQTENKNTNLTAEASRIDLELAAVHKQLQAHAIEVKPATN